MGEQMIDITCENDVIVARKSGREIAHQLGFGLADQTRLATAISELARNVVEYAGKGHCKIISCKSDGLIQIQVYVVDHGPGIPDIERAMVDGYSSKNSLGAGLSGTKRLMNQFDIQSKPGHTEIKIIIESKIND